jgi:predicted DNA-binding protein
VHYTRICTEKNKKDRVFCLPQETKKIILELSSNTSLNKSYKKANKKIQHKIIITTIQLFLSQEVTFFFVIKTRVIKLA